mmetsp:Transcript_61414/g.164957  ORF Transcript_61414/g.164957 Transcript_61414/m.164957 type:complete len:122 (-) Transcript_61414:494-859(-)
MNWAAPLLPTFPRLASRSNCSRFQRPISLRRFPSDDVAELFKCYPPHWILGCGLEHGFNVFRLGLKIEQKQQYCSHILGNDKPHIVHCQLFHLHTTVKTAIEEPSNTEKASCSSSSEISWP